MPSTLDHRHGWLIRSVHERTGTIEYETAFDYDHAGRLTRTRTKSFEGIVTVDFVASCP